MIKWINRLIFLGLALWVAFMASAAISWPFGYRPVGEIFLTILGLSALVLFIRWRRQRKKDNIWDDPRVDDARSAVVLALSRKRGY